MAADAAYAMETFFEQVVKRERNLKSTVICIFTVFITVFIPITLILLAGIVTEYLFMVAFFAFLFLLYLAWYVISNQNVEFEYSVVSDDITISKITAKRKRKTLITFSAKNIEDMQLLSKTDAPVQSYDKTVFAGNDKDSNLCWATVYSEKSGRSLIIFSPDSDFINAIKPYLKRSVINDLSENRGVN